MHLQVDLDHLPSEVRETLRQELAGLPDAALVALLAETEAASDELDAEYVNGELRQAVAVAMILEARAEAARRSIGGST